MRVWFIEEKTTCIVSPKLKVLLSKAKVYVGLSCTALPIGGVKTKSSGSSEARAIWPGRRAKNHYKVVNFDQKSIKRKAKTNYICFFIRRKEKAKSAFYRQKNTKSPCEKSYFLRQKVD